MICVLGPRAGSARRSPPRNLAVAPRRRRQRGRGRRPRPAVRRRRSRARPAPERTIYDLATSGGSLDARRSTASCRRTESGVRVLLAPAAPDQAGAITVEFLRDVYATLPRDVRLRHRRHPAGLHARGDRLDRQLDAHLHGRHARRALAEEHEARPRDARADGLRPRADPPRAQPRRQRTSGISSRRRRAILGRAPDVLVPSDRDDPAVGQRRRSRSCSAEPRSDAAQGVPRAGRATTPPSRAARRRGAASDTAGAVAAAGRKASMELHERTRDVRPIGDGHRRRATRSRRSRTGSTWRSSASSGRSSSTRHRPDVVRERVVADIRERTSPRSRALARGPRAPRRRDRRRHPRPRPARAARSPTTASPRSWSTGRRHLGRARGPPVRRRRPLHRRVAPAPDHQQDRRPGRAPHRRVVADGRCAPARRQPRERDHPAAVALGPAASRSASSARSASTSSELVRLGTLTHESVDFLAALRRGGAEHPDLRRHGLRQDDAPQRAVGRDPGRRAHRHDRGRRRAAAATSSTCSGSRRARRTSRARARSRSATWFATRCACGPTGSSSARSAAPRRSTCSRR